MKKKRYLITSSDEKLWKFDRPVIFLGEWCKIYNNKQLWQSIDYIVSKPFGATKDDKEFDLYQTNKIEEQLNPIFFSILNKIHSVNYSDRFWTILLGHWLRRYIRTVYNRIGTIEYCLNSYDISGVTFYFPDEIRLANLTTSQNNYLDEKWNSTLDCYILDYFNIDFRKEYIINKNSSSEANKKIFTFNHLIKYAFNIFINFLQLFSRKNDAFIISPKISKFKEILLHIKLKQFPQIWRTPSLKIKTSENSNYRIELQNQYKSFYEDKKLQIIFDLFFQCIPVCFLEGFIELNDLANSLPWPQTPKFIFTSNNFDTDELFKLWTALKTENNTQYFVGQHGGGYGTYKYSNPTIEEITSDKFLTWGWKDGIDCHVPFYNFRVDLNNFKKYNPNGNILLIEIGLDFRINTWDSYSEFENYIKSQFDFISLLDSNILKLMIIRLKAEFELFNGNELIRWNEFNSNMKIDDGKKPIFKLIENSRLVIHSYDSTGFLETMSLNIPSLLFLYNGFDDLRYSAHENYNVLLDAGILHFNSHSLSQKVNEIVNDIENWWNSDTVQMARIKFCQNYSNTSKNVIKDLALALEAK